MTVTRLRVEDFRCLREVEIDLIPGCNVIFGANGSGKTSLLEAIHFLPTGKSFRAARAQSVIRHTSRQSTVFGVVSHDGMSSSIGMSRSRDGTRVLRVNGEEVHAQSVVARLLPVQVLGPRTVELILAGPDTRRKFLNFGVFHVKPLFQESWVGAERCLRHRNRLLRTESRDIAEYRAWETQLARFSHQVDEMRCAHVAEVDAELQRLLSATGFGQGISVSYQKGWDETEADGELSAILELERQRDIEKGFTGSGHHRAELKIRVEGYSAADTLSRGELKLVSWLLTIAQTVVMRRHGNKATAFLVDDVQAELDSAHLSSVCHLLTQTHSQLVFTCINPSPLRDLLTECSEEAAWFGADEGDIRPF